MNFRKNNQNAAILKIIKISKIATADLQQITQSYFNSKKNLIQVYTHLFKDWKYLSPTVCCEPYLKRGMRIEVPFSDSQDSRKWKKL